MKELKEDLEEYKKKSFLDKSKIDSKTLFSIDEHVNTKDGIGKITKIIEPRKVDSEIGLGRQYIVNIEDQEIPYLENEIEKVAQPAVTEEQEVDVEEIARQRIQIEKILKEFSDTLSDIEERLRDQFKISEVMKQKGEVDPLLIDAIEKLGSWEMRIDGWRLAIHKAGRAGFKQKEFRERIEKLITEMAPFLLEKFKEIEFQATTVPDPNALKLEVEKEEEFRPVSGFLVDMWNKFKNWLKEKFFGIASTIDKTMDEIGSELELLFVEASLIKEEKMMENSEFDFTKGAWELVETSDGAKEFIFKGDLKTRIEKALSGKESCLRVNQKVMLDFGDRVIEGTLVKIQDGKCSVIVNGKLCTFPSNIITPILV